MRILVVGPSPTRSKGGMATVIEEIEKDKTLNSKFNIDIYFRYFHLLGFISQKEIMIFTIYMQLHTEVHSEKVCMFMPRKSGAKK